MVLSLGSLLELGSLEVVELVSLEEVELELSLEVDSSEEELSSDELLDVDPSLEVVSEEEESPLEDPVSDEEEFVGNGNELRLPPHALKRRAAVKENINLILLIGDFSFLAGYPIRGINLLIS